MLERVGDAQRIATMQMRETDKRRKGKRKGGGGNDDDRDGDDGQMCVTVASCNFQQCRSLLHYANCIAMHLNTAMSLCERCAGSRGNMASDDGVLGCLSDATLLALTTTYLQQR